MEWLILLIPAGLVLYGFSSAAKRRRPPIRCSCPKCGQHYEVDHDMTATPICCRKCGEVFRVPPLPPGMICCPVCNARIAASASACPHCGATRPKPPVTLEGLLHGCLLIIVLPVAGAVGIVLFLPPILWIIAFPLLLIIWIIAAASGLRAR